jgi:hypothetical protein
LGKIWLIVKHDSDFGENFVAAFSDIKSTWKGCEELAGKEIPFLRQRELDVREARTIVSRQPAKFRVGKLKQNDFPFNGFGVYVKEWRRSERLAVSFRIEELPFEELPAPKKAAFIDMKTRSATHPLVGGWA